MLGLVFLKPLVFDFFASREKKLRRVSLQSLFSIISSLAYFFMEAMPMIYKYKTMKLKRILSILLRQFSVFSGRVEGCYPSVGARTISQYRERGRRYAIRLLPSAQRQGQADLSGKRQGFSLSIAQCRYRSTRCTKNI